MVQESLIAKVDSRRVELIYLYTVILTYKMVYIFFVIYSDDFLSLNNFSSIQCTQLILTKLNLIFRNSWKFFLPISTRFVLTPFDSNDIIKLPDTFYLKQLIESSIKLSAYWLLLFLTIQDWLLPWNISESSA